MKLEYQHNELGNRTHRKSCKHENTDEKKCQLEQTVPASTNRQWLDASCRHLLV